MLKIVIANLLNKNTKYAAASKIRGVSGLNSDGYFQYY
jgi:hypothetical protein